MNIRPLILLTLLLPMASLAAPLSDEDSGPTEEQRRAYEEALRHAEEDRARAAEATARAREELQQLQQREAERTAEERESAERRREELQRMREELSRAHQELRESSREVARLHRDLAREERERVRFAYFGEERAVIGVVLGAEQDGGVQVLGVSPDGPAEKAGVQPGDVIMSVNGQSLAAPAPAPADGAPSAPRPAAAPRASIHRIMEDVKPGDALALEVHRGDERLALEVIAERREPLVYESMLRLEPPPVPGAPRVLVERIEVPDIDTEALERQVHELTRQFESVHRVAPGAPMPPLPGYSVSMLGDVALGEANLWFGLPLARGLQLARLGPQLGEYFNAERGVLVLEADEENGLKLEPGDVIQSINGNEVNEPADVYRALRTASPGDSLAIDVKRKRRDRSIETEMPELGWNTEFEHSYRFSVRQDEEHEHGDDD